MEVILMERVEKLGQLGDQVKVKPGFARNFLIPKGKAVRATEPNRKILEEQLGKLEARNLEKRSEAESIAKKMEGVSIELIRQAGETGQLYGSVTKRDATLAISETGFSVDRTQVHLEKPIKTLGLHTISISLHPEVTIEIIANIARTSDEAKAQQKTGRPSNTLNEAPTESKNEPTKLEVETAADEAVIQQADKIFEESAKTELIEPKINNNPDDDTISN